MRAMSTAIEMLGRVFAMPRSSVMPAAITPPAAVADNRVTYPVVSVESDVEFDEQSNEVLFIGLMIAESPDRVQTMTMSPATAAAVVDALTKCLSTGK